MTSRARNYEAERAKSGAWPEPCPKCEARAKLRKFCEHCDTPVFVIEHGPHYMGGANEVIPCLCAMRDTRQGDKHRQAKKRKRMTQETGKQWQPYKPRRVNPTYTTTPEMAKKAAENLAKGMQFYPALKDAGFSDSTAKHCGKAVNKMIRAEMKNLGKRFIEMARDITPEEQELLVRGKLLDNIYRNTDKAVLSAKQLGADKRVAMWTPDSQVGMVILQAPPIPVIDHEVPLFPVEHIQVKETPMERHQEEDDEPQADEVSPDPAEVEAPEPEVWEEEERKHDPER